MWIKEGVVFLGGGVFREVWFYEFEYSSFVRGRVLFFWEIGFLIDKS